MSDEPGLFCVMVGAGMASFGAVVTDFDRALALFCIIAGAVFVALGAFFVWQQHWRKP